MVNFQRMKDELDGFGSQVSTKLPVVNRGSCVVLSLIVVLVIVIFGLAIGLGVQKRVGGGPSSSGLTDSIPSAFIFVSNNSGSCPPLVADRLLTVTRQGESFEGLVVNLACRGDFNPFPNQVNIKY